MSANPEEESQLLPDVQIATMLESIDERCRVGSCAVEQRDLSDPIQQLLSKENFNDVQDYVLDEAVLVKVFPEASPERIKVERDLQSSHYVLQNFLVFEKHSARLSFQATWP